DLLSQSARLGWMPSYPTFGRNPLDLADEARAAGVEPRRYVARRVASGELGFACEDPDAPENWPRVLTVWRVDLRGLSAEGAVYGRRHLRGADASLRAREADLEQRPRELTWRAEAPQGKLDRLLSLDFRMTSTTLFSDIVLPAATWSEKHDLS